MKIADIRAAIKAKADIVIPPPASPTQAPSDKPKSTRKKKSSATANNPETVDNSAQNAPSTPDKPTLSVPFPNEKIEIIVAKYLLPNQDYAVIPHTTKPTLLKGGAEKLASVFGFHTSCSIANRIENFDYDKPANSFVQYEAKVIVYNRAGEVVSEGYGSCNSSESKFLKQPFANRINTVLKISKKRAYVDAILTATCASSVFTQDMEDIVNFQEQENSK